eukprot:1158605-Pelagomonas_calceolata.AAC.3
MQGGYSTPGAGSEVDSSVHAPSASPEASARSMFVGNVPHSAFDEEGAEEKRPEDADVVEGIPSPRHKQPSLCNNIIEFECVSECDIRKAWHTASCPSCSLCASGRAKLNERVSECDIRKAWHAASCPSCSPCTSGRAKLNERGLKAAGVSKHVCSVVYARFMCPWDEVSVEHRIQRLYHFAVEIWPGPAESVFNQTKVCTEPMHESSGLTRNLIHSLMPIQVFNCKLVELLYSESPPTAAKG